MITPPVPIHELPRWMQIFYFSSLILLAAMTFLMFVAAGILAVLKAFGV